MSFLLNEIANIIQFSNGEGVDLTSDVFEKLYAELLNEMPYGIAKARDGDPQEWIENWVISHFGLGPILEEFTLEDIRKILTEHKNRVSLSKKNPTFARVWENLQTLEKLI